jgi:hypothetical protein
MSKLLIPKQYAKNKENLFIAQVFFLNEAGQIAPGSLIFPQPTNGKFNGAFLSQIHAELPQVIDGILQTALQAGEVKALLRITELQKFLAEKAKLETINALRNSTQAKPVTEAANGADKPGE